MSTKNEFFAAYFLEQIEVLKNKIEEFEKMDETYFGSEIDPDKSKSIEEQLDQLHKTDDVLDTIRYIEDQWHNCVAKNATEGYPVIDMWNEKDIY